MSKKKPHKKKEAEVVVEKAVQGPTKLLSLQNLILALIVLLSIVTLRSTIDDGHSWGDDFALYIEQAKAISEGSIQELYEQNKYSMDNSNIVLGPYLYPMGFPFLLSPVYSMFGIDFIAMKAFCSAFFILSLPFIFFLFVKDFKQMIYPLIIVTFAAFNYNYTLFCDNVLSDLPFMFFCFLGIWMMERTNSLMKAILLGLVFVMAYSIRDVGILLIPTFITYQWFSQRKLAKEDRTDTKILVAPYMVFAVLLVGLKLLLPDGGGNIPELLERISMETIGSNVNYYIVLTAKFVFVKDVDFDTGIYWLLPRLLLLLVAIGIFLERKSRPHYAVFFIATCMIYILWPETQGMRFVYPLIPFGFYFMIKAMIFLSEKIKVPKLAQSLAVILCLFSTMTSLNFSKEQAPKDRDMFYAPELQALFTRITSEIPADKTIGFHKPRGLRLFTERNATYHPLIGEGVCNSDYILVLRTEQMPPYPEVFGSRSFALLENKSIR